MPVRLSPIMFDQRIGLRDEHVIGQRLVVQAIAPELFTTIKGFGRVRKDFKDDGRIGNYIAVLIVVFRVVVFVEPLIGIPIDFTFLAVKE